MVRAILAAAILLTASCSTLSRFGGAVCESQEEVSAAIDDGLSWLGAPGQLTAQIVDTTLTIGCKLLDVAVNVPNDLATDVGLVEGAQPDESQDDPEGPASRPSGGDHGCGR